MNPPTLDDFRAVHDAPPVPLTCFHCGRRGEHSPDCPVQEEGET